MKQTEMKQNLPEDQELDAMLAQMAEEVPPMPADFHARWTSAVRGEAERGHAEEEQSKTGTVVLWTRILSAAAVFVFLIGGTLLYRNSKGTPVPVYQAENRKAAFTAGGTEDTAAAVEAEEANEDAGPPMVMFAAPAAYTANESDGMTAGEAEYADAEEQEAEAEEAAEEPASLPQEEAAEETAGETEEESGFLKEAGSFFTDMGDFLLAALPYLLVLAVPAAAALILRKRKKTN